MRVAVRGFDIEHHVEGFVVEGQVLGIASYEIQTGQIVSFLAKLDTGLVQVQPRVGGRLQGAHEVRGSAAVAATDLQHPFAAQIRLGRRAVVQVDVGSVGLVGRLQRQGHRRILFIGPVDEHNFVGTEPTCHQRVPVPPNFLVGRGTSHAGEEAVGGTEGHGEGVWQTRNTNDPIAGKKKGRRSAKP